MGKWRGNRKSRPWSLGMDMDMDAVTPALNKNDRSKLHRQ